MSADQFSNKPLRKTCPYCGQVIAATDTMCWLCLEKYSIQDGGTAPTRSKGAAKTTAPHAVGDSAAWAVFGVVAVMLCVAMAYEAPGVLIVLLVVAVPAMVRAFAASSQQQGATSVTRRPSFVLLFLNSLGIATLVGIASFSAFFATCFAVCLGGLSIGAFDGRGSENMILTCSVGGGGIVGLIVAGLLFRLFWPRKTPADGEP